MITYRAIFQIFKINDTDYKKLIIGRTFPSNFYLFMAALESQQKTLCMQKPVIFLRLKQKHFSFSFSIFFVASSNSTSLPSNRNDSFGRAHRRRRSFLQKGFTAAVSRRTAEILDPVVGLPGIIVDPVIRRFPKVGCRRV